MAIERIKGIREKNSGSYNSLVPFGTDGNLVDMASGLDLEEQFKLGGDHSTTIDTDANGVVNIIENYATSAVMGDSTKSYYQVSTRIRNNSDKSITISAILRQMPSGTELRRKETTITTSSNNTSIKEELK